MWTKIILLLAVAFTLLPADGSNGAPSIILEWAHQPVGNIVDSINAVSIDPDGDIFVAGYNGYNHYLSRYDISGQLIWTKDGEGLGVHAMKADRGNFYTVGNTGQIGFVAKYNDSGRRQWLRLLGAPQSLSHNLSVAVDGSGSLFVAGTTSGNLGGESFGGYDAFIAKYAANGTLGWMKQFGTRHDDYIFGMDIDRLGNLVVAGKTNGSLYAVNGSSPHHSDDVFISKFDAFGTGVWAHQYGGRTIDIGEKVAIDAAGNAFVVGITRGSIGGASRGGLDVFVEKRDSDGDRLWTRQYGTPDDDWSEAIATDRAGTAYVAITHVVENGINDIFDGAVQRISAEGFLLERIPFVTSSTDRVNDIATGPNRVLLVAGYAGGELFGSTVGGRPGFLALYQQVPEPGSILLSLVGVICTSLVSNRRHREYRLKSLTAALLWVKICHKWPRLRHMRGPTTIGCSHRYDA
jgi:hypothetical protein